MNRLKSQLHFLHVFKDAKPQARRTLLSSASDELIKAIIECCVDTLNGNLKLCSQEKSKLSKFKKLLRALVNPQIGLRHTCKILIKKGGFIVPLLKAYCLVL
jgi:hypothetical protein